MEKIKQPFPAGQPPVPTFKVAAIGEGKCTLESYNRRDFYKITLVTKCDSQLLYASRGINVKGQALIFTNPLVPYSWTGHTDEEDAEGYFCVFNESFLQTLRNAVPIQDSLLFKAKGEPVYFLSDHQVSYLLDIFARMRKEIDSEYTYKYDLMRSQLTLLMHEALKMQPANAYFSPPNAAARITQLFTSLLNKQFPVDAPQHILHLKKASDYADMLAIHVNYLNAAVQEITGKATTAHINEKLITEASSMLLHTNLSVASIAGSLGFDYASYFNNFYKKHTGVTPLSLRKKL